ncbi:MAG TPA: PD-(D/E)XK nuclease family protein, partial [Longimicrobiales bacterium]|nr:PD-(D/E)XK nuclease family protein [Longimicrobiales bacterium]
MTTNTINLVDAVASGIRRGDDWGKDSLHVTDLRHALPGEGCPRQLWLRLRGAEARPHTLGEQLRFDRGHYFHEYMVDVLNKGLPKGWTVKLVEQSLTGLLPHGIRGTLDVLLEHPGGVRVLDFKTVRGRAFAYLDDAKLAHQLQVRTYSMAIDAEGADVLYIDREGTNGVRAFRVERDDEQVRACAEAVVGYASADEPEPVLEPELGIRENKGPDSVYLNEPWQCQYCEFRDVSCPGALPR